MRLPMILMLLLTYLSFNRVMACSGPILTRWYDLPKFSAAKTDFVYLIRITEKRKSGESFIYAFDVIKSFKKPFVGKSKELKIKRRTYDGKSKFPLELGPDCEVRGELYTGRYYLHLPDRYNHTLPLSGPDDKILKDLLDSYPR